MRGYGRVVAVAPDRATVELEPAAACARCARGRGCGAALFAPAGRALRIDCAAAAERITRGATSEAPLAVGDEVEIVLGDDGSRWLLPIVLAYGLPTVGLVAGACVAEPWTPFAALAGLGGGLLAWRVSGARVPAGSSVGPCLPVARRAQDRESRISSGENA